MDLPITTCALLPPTTSAFTSATTFTAELVKLCDTAPAIAPPDATFEVNVNASAVVLFVIPLVVVKVEFVPAASVTAFRSGLVLVPRPVNVTSAFVFEETLKEASEFAVTVPTVSSVPETFELKDPTVTVSDVASVDTVPTLDARLDV
jgi:hypothetical protein